jgi:diguanylate cyclase (GGDEF)-like protein
VIVESTGIPISYLGQPAVAGILRDVTRERALEAAERASAAKVAAERALLEAIIANIEDGVALLAPDSSLLMANRVYADLFGLDVDAIVGMSRASFLARTRDRFRDPDQVAERLNTASATSDKMRDEFELLVPRRVLRRTAKRVRIPGAVGAAGEGTLVVWHDVTAERDLVAERERQALTDALTGIANRRGAEHVLAREVERASRAGSALSVAMFDIDRFKRINDAHGHPAGDEVLRQVAAALQARARKTDTVARWGGEEFVAIVLGDLEGARAYCERARLAVAGLRFPGHEGVTISAGAVEWRAGERFEQTVARADQRLYAAKQNGRDRVET